MSEPYFSIIIPVFNRERLVGRAIDSCLLQDFDNYEIIIIDDGSADKSVEVVEDYKDVRIRLIRHETNRGVGPARNTGVSNATGTWVLCLDSDDELLPGALAAIYRRSLEVDEGSARLTFMVRMETGMTSPHPPLEKEHWDYLAYIRWMESVFGGLSETLPVVRRTTFEEVRYVDDRTLEGLYHLDFMKKFNAWSFPDVVRVYHKDAENQLTKPNMIQTMASAHDQAASGELILDRHGDALRNNAPRVYRQQLSGLATLFFLSGDRPRGVKYSISSLEKSFFSFKHWGILLLGLLGRKPIAWVKAKRTQVL